MHIGGKNIMSKRSNKTFKVRDAVLLVFVHLKATMKIRGLADNFFLENLIAESMGKIKEEDKKYMVGTYSGEKFVIGGHLDSTLHEEFKELCMFSQLNMSQLIELCIFLYAKEHLNLDTIEFFKIDEWSIGVLPTK